MNEMFQENERDSSIAASDRGAGGRPVAVTVGANSPGTNGPLHDGRDAANGAKLVVSPARTVTGGSFIPGLVDADFYSDGSFAGTFPDLGMGQAKSLAAQHGAFIEADGRKVWP